MFDHVEATLLKQDAKGITLLLKSPTLHDATVSVFAETSMQATKALDYTAFVRWPKVKLNAVETRQLLITADGKVKLQ